MDIVILHGTGGSPEGNWFPWLKQELEGRGHTVFVPRLPTPANQTKEAWCEALREQAPLFGANTVLIGHSCGATFVLHILEVVRNPVRQAILVSPFLDALGNPDFDALNKTFYDHAFNWEAIKANVARVDVVHGSDDPYVPVPQAEAVADHLGVALTLVEGGQHLNAEAGFTQFPLLLEMIDDE